MRLIAICVVALVFGFVGSMPLAGPIALMAVARSSHGKYSEALRIGLGAAAAEGLYAAIAFWGFTTFLASHAFVVPLSHAVTAIVLAAVGIRFVFWKPSEGKERERTRRDGAFSASRYRPSIRPLSSPGALRSRPSYSEGSQGPAAGLRDPVWPMRRAPGSVRWFLILVTLVQEIRGQATQRGR